MHARLVIGSLLIAGTANTHGQSAGMASGKTAHPNIIYILADDLGYGDLGCYGQKKFATPHIDSLAASGIRFTRHYAGSTVCAPSRSSLMTGLHTGHTPVRGNKEWEPEGQWPLPDSSITLAELLKKAGLKTGAFGKWGLGYPGSEGDPSNQGFDEFFGYNCQRMAHNYYPYHLWHNRKKIILENNKGTAKGTYAPDLIHQKALEFIKNNRDSAFFLYYANTIPHAELLIPEEKLLPFKNRFIPEKSFAGIDSGVGYRTGAYGSQSQAHAAFAAMVTLLDKQVGELVMELRKLGIDNNTIIIFTSDNGPHLEGGADPDYFNSNGPLRGYKRDLYEGGIRVPMIIRWPGMIVPGRTSDHVSAFWDVLPTLVELTGGEIPAATDGISFLPELLGNNQAQHDYLYWEFHEQGGRKALISGKWKVVQHQVNTIPPGAFELYDLDADPGETRNLALSYPDRMEKMKELLGSARTSSLVFTFTP